MYKSISHLNAFLLLLVVFSYASECRPIFFSGLPFSYTDFNSSIEWKEVQVKFANLDHSYKISVPANSYVCKNASLFVFVSTRTTSFAIREGIRNSYAKNLAEGIAFRFVIGQADNIETIHQILEEQEKFGDLILYDVHDNYEMLYFKTYSALLWQQTFCSNVKFVMKLDDDVIIDLQRLQYWIDKKMEPLHREHERTESGSVNFRMHPRRNIKSPWYVSTENFSDSLFPPYTSGAMCLFSNEAVAAILEQTPNASAFSVEDALFMGVLAKLANVYVSDNKEHFRIGGLRKTEMCECGVPLVTAIYAFHKAEDFAMNYELLRNVECTE
uniref:Hexosyltransferase n=1 Tax=Ditylenchus dipsaci TaxID=166011 RepID=A0A915DSX4_9BILA